MKRLGRSLALSSAVEVEERNSPGPADGLLGKPGLACYDVR
jgi:hypothetical protein